MADPDFEDLNIDSGMSELMNSLAGVTNAIGSLGASLSPPAGSSASVIAGGAAPSMTAMTNAAASINSSVASLGGAIGSLNANMQDAKRAARFRAGQQRTQQAQPNRSQWGKKPTGNNTGGTGGNKGGGNTGAGGGGGGGGNGGDSGGGGAGAVAISILKVVKDLFEKSLTLYSQLDASILARGYTTELQYKAIMSLRGSLSELSKVTQNNVLQAALKTGLERNFLGLSKILGRADAVGLNINQMAEDIRAYSNTMLLSTSEQTRVSNELDKLAFNYKSSTDKLISAMRDLADRMPVQALTGQTAIMEGLAKIQAMTGERLSDPTFVAKTFVPLITGGFNNALREYLVGAPMLQESLVGKSAEEVANYILSIIKYAEEAPAANIVLDPRNTRMVQSSDMYKDAADTIYRMQQIRKALEDVPVIRELKTPKVEDVQNSLINVTNELQHAIYSITEGFTNLSKKLNTAIVRITSFSILIGSLAVAILPSIKDMFGGLLDGFSDMILKKLGLGGLIGVGGGFSLTGWLYNLIVGSAAGGGATAAGGGAAAAGGAAAGAATRRAVLKALAKKAATTIAKGALRGAIFGGVTLGIGTLASWLLTGYDLMDIYNLYDQISNLNDPEALKDPEMIKRLRESLFDGMDLSDISPEELKQLTDMGLISPQEPKEKPKVGSGFSTFGYAPVMPQPIPKPELIDVNPEIRPREAIPEDLFNPNPMSPIPLPPTAPAAQEEEVEMTPQQLMEKIQEGLEEYGIVEFAPIKDQALIDAVLQNNDQTAESLSVLDLIQRNTYNTSRTLKQQNEDRFRVEATSYQARDLLMRQAALIGESFGRMSTMDALMRKAEVSDERYQLALEANSYLKNASDYLKTLNEKVTRPTNPGLRDRDRIGR